MKLHNVINCMFVRRAMLIILIVIISLLFSSMMFAGDLIINSQDYTVNRHGDKNVNGALINLWVKNDHISQEWIFDDDGTIHSSTDRNFCLNIHNNAIKNGGVVNLWSCNGHDSQKWKRTGNLITPLYNSNYCLNLHNYDNSNGATINLWKCNGHDSQKWFVETK